MESWYGRSLAMVLGFLLLAGPEGLGPLAPTRANAQGGDVQTARTSAPNPTTTRPREASANRSSIG